MRKRFDNGSLKRMKRSANICYSLMESENRPYTKPVLGLRHRAIEMFKERRSIKEIKENIHIKDDKLIVEWLKEKFTSDEIKEALKKDMVEDFTKRFVERSIEEYISKGVPKERIQSYIAERKLLAENPNFKSKADIEDYVRNIMNEMEQKKTEER